MFASSTPVRSRRRLRMALAAAATVAAAVGAVAVPASAHTESEYAAVPAGEQITVNFAPTHGCSGSPTTAVSVRVPAPGATAGEVEGFVSSAEADGDRTILRWTGGVVPADEEGEFPITFNVPDQVGELLLFPTVQTCEVGEVAWIDGDPEGEHPAVRILVLAAGSEPAHTVDEVPADAPGRELLTSIVDVDNPDTGGTTLPPTAAPVATTAPATATTAPGSTATTATTATAEGAADPTAAAPSSTDAATSSPAPGIGGETDAGDDDGSNAGTIVFIVVVLVVGIGAAAGILLRRRNSL